jgi:hypothetical protein
MSTIKSSTTTTTAYQVVADTTGALVIQTGATPTTAVTIDTSQNVSLAKNLTFTGTGNRITGDWSTATITDRPAFQTSVVNGFTSAFVLPNGTGNLSQWIVSNNSDPTNAGVTRLYVSSTESRLEAGITGTGTYLPLTFQVNGSERVRVDTSGNVGIGVTPSPSAASGQKVLQVANGIFANNGGSGYITNNVYYTSGYVATYVSTAAAQMIGLNRTGANDIQFLVAPSGTANTAMTLVEAMRIDSSANVGIGATPSAWGSGAGAIQTVNNAFFTGYGNSGYIGQNAYRDGSGVWKYQSTNPAARYGVGQGDGSFEWSRAASGTADTAITFTTAMSLDASSNLKFNSGYGSAATAYGCRAWVSFNGTGTVAIRGSGNVSSITDNGTGDYTVNFSTAMPDANYASTGSAQAQPGSFDAFFQLTTTANPTASACRFLVQFPGTGQKDSAFVSYIAFR